MGRRRRVVFLAIGLVVFTGALGLWFRYIEPIWDHSRWYGRVRENINALTHKRPPEVNKGQWEFAVGWTINLHANCGSIWSAVEPGWRDGFTVELERRMAGPITLTDIEWIWDEYARHTTYGQTYSDKWRPTKAEEFRYAQEGCFGIPVE